LVGRVTSATDARTATGWSGTGAERLLGRGDFIAVAEGRLIRFQGAYVSPSEIRQVVARITQGAAMASPSKPALPWPMKRVAEVLRGGMQG
jgi:DNA segregation ATPase FtsK/SpoIIIE-like protein